MFYSISIIIYSCYRLSPILKKKINKLKYVKTTIFFISNLKNFELRTSWMISAFLPDSATRMSVMCLPASMHVHIHVYIHIYLCMYVWVLLCGVIESKLFDWFWCFYRQLIQLSFAKTHENNQNLLQWNDDTMNWFFIYDVPKTLCCQYKKNYIFE